MSEENFKMSRILALADKPTNGASMRDWCPFAGSDSLDAILNNINEKIIEYLKPIWDWDDIVQSGLVYDVNPSGLSTLDQLSIDTLRDIRILLIDLDAFNEEKKKHEGEKKLKILKSRMLQAIGKQKEKYPDLPVKTYIIAQLSRSIDITSQFNFFELMAAKRSIPEIIRNQEDLESFLDRDSGLYVTAAKVALEQKDSSLLNSPSAKAEFRNAIPKIAAKARDVSYQQGLHALPIELSAKAEAIREAAFINTSETIAAMIAAPSKDRISWDLLQLPLRHIPVESLIFKPKMQEVQLVKLTLSTPWAELTKDQTKISMNLGLMPDFDAAIQLNEPKLWVDVKTLKKLGGTIQTEKFSALLPSW